MSEHLPLTIHDRDTRITGHLSATEAGGAPRALILVAQAATGQRSRVSHAGEVFREAGFVTLEIDLLTPREERFQDLHSDLPLLTHRLLASVSIAHREAETRRLPLGIFASATAAPAAIRAAATRDTQVDALVCRGGLIDMAGKAYLNLLRAPLLFLTAEGESGEVASSARAQGLIECPMERVIIARQDNLMDDPLAYDEAVHHGVHWFNRHLQASWGMGAGG